MRLLAGLATLVAVLTVGAAAQIANPVSDAVAFGGLVLELEPYVTLPATTDEGPRVYRRNRLPALDGVLRFSDIPTGRVFYVRRGAGTRID